MAESDKWAGSWKDVDTVLGLLCRCSNRNNEGIKLRFSESRTFASVVEVQQGMAVKLFDAGALREVEAQEWR